VEEIIQLAQNPDWQARYCKLEAKVLCVHFGVCHWRHTKVLPGRELCGK